MWVASELGEGSEFHMLVPLPPRHATGSGPPASLQGVSCLIVDDNLTNRKILHAITTQWSMKSDAAESAVLALSALEAAASGNTAYKLVLIDGHMPEMDGFQLAERIRQNPKLTGAIVLMLTSGGQPGDIDRCRELGISAYLIKPIRRSELLDVVLRVLDSGAEGSHHGLRRSSCCRMPPPPSFASSPPKIIWSTSGSSPACWKAPATPSPSSETDWPRSTPASRIATTPS